MRVEGIVEEMEATVRRWPAALVLILLTLPGSARAAVEVAGVLLPEKVRIAPNSAPVELNGVGVHTRYFFVDVYVAALYLPEARRDPTAVLAADGPQRLFLHFLRDVSPERAHQIWEKLGANGGDLERLRGRREHFESVFKQGLKKGDDIAFDYLPGTGTRIRLNGQTKTVIAGEDFYDALLKIWIGEKPVSRGLKRGLLGR